MHRPSLLLPVALALTTAVVTACAATIDDTSNPVADAARGTELFQNNCARCHGVGAVGTDEGPTFLDPVYEPGHHADEAFHLAAARGVQQHHWDFGPMPAVGAENDLTRDDVADIIAYVRGLQREAGIE